MDPARETRPYTRANAKSFAPKYGETEDLAIRISGGFTSHWSSRRTAENWRLSMPVIPICKLIFQRTTDIPLDVAFFDGFSLIEFFLAPDDTQRDFYLTIFIIH